MVLSKRAVCFYILFSLINSSYAQDSSKEEQRFNLHFQTTYIYQYKPSLHSPYEGANSLAGRKERQNSLTATLYLGARLWQGAELYINPEVAGGSGLSGALGMAGSSNGETFRVGDPAPTLYVGRFFLKQTFALNSNKEWQASDANQLSGMIPKNHLSIYLGKFSLGDLFDNNEYSNSSRTQFMNWSLMNNGAWDYAANLRGYTYSFSTEWQLDKMSYKVALATLPKVANGEKLNTRFRDSFAIAVNAEIGRAYTVNSKKGNVRLLGYYNDANMGNYKEANRMNGVPEIVSTRKLGRTRWGWGINFDQELSQTTGLFGRLGWNNGKNETWAFTEIDRTASLGASFNGSNWKRKDDIAGVAFVLNGLAEDHRNYLAKGGTGFMIGDGALNYGVEAISEWYYNYKPSVNLPLWLTGDYQFCLHPGYNKDRGPAHIFSIRVHTEF
ncbi:MAG: carbohydrate porin [Flavisolibacter sp.]|nr:carbohydrate porin [Flavisolibacter sp.]